MGRTVIVVGSREEIAERLAKLRGADSSGAVQLDSEELSEQQTAMALDLELAADQDEEIRTLLHALAPPDLPRRSIRAKRPSSASCSTISTCGCGG